jgi:hypothetical protein
MQAPARSLFLLLALASAAWTYPTSPSESVTLRGKVVTLVQALESRGLGLKPDSEPIAKQIVLLAEDESIVPLLSDDGSRALFLDERLRNCRSEIKGRRFVGVPYIQVLSFKVEMGGKLQTPEYYCDICAISVPYPRICDCCQGPTTLRARPER